MKIVGVKFNNNTKVYYFNSKGLDLKVNLTVIVNIINIITVIIDPIIVFF